jgi:tripartite-type tricarboxylate transporter receptor subunit TctC
MEDAMRISRRIFISAFGSAPVLPLLAQRALAAYPDRPIHLIVPFAAGGNADIVGRITGDLISKALGQPIVVENRGGGGGSIGAEFVAHATPDGYTLLVGSNGPLTVDPFVHANLGYDPLKDFIAVALTSYVPHALILSNKIQAKTMTELVAQSKTNAVTIATSGIGSATHMTLERLKAVTGANFTHVPYRGGGALMPDLISGTIDGAMTEFSTALPMHQAAQAHIIGIAALHRSKLAPDITTFDESGVKGFRAQSYIGVVAPAKTPADVIDKLQQTIAQGLSPGSAAAERLISLGSEVASPEQMTAKGFAEFIHADYDNMREAAKLAGITPQ